MDAPSFERLRQIVLEVARARPERREEILARECGSDDGLRAAVLRLLAHDPGDLSLERPEGRSDAVGNLTGSPTAPASTLSADETIGPYRLLEKIGEGGMGEVWRAEQTHPIRRQVALKVIKAGLDTKHVVARFEAERQVLALMDHPVIAKVHEAGETPRGLPYFVMEYVAGEPVTDYCDRNRLRTRDRLDLFERICEGVQHAHQKGVIHRDLKPSNVLVTVQDDRPAPKIIDFGIAKATAHRLTERTLFTELGVMVGTPSYMSPEQADPGGQDVDTRTDVYALGVMLYELLTGVLPFDARTLREAGYEEIRRRIREDDPPRPSTRARGLSREESAEIAKRRGTVPARLASRLRGDLDWIVMKCLEKDRARRYASPNELAADLRRHVANEPVDAGPPGATYRVGKFVRRHRGGVGITAAAAIGLTAFAWSTQSQNRRIAAERDRAEQESAKAVRIQEFLQGMLSSVNPWDADFQSSELTVREVLDAAAERVGPELAGQPEVEASVRRTIGQTYISLGRYDEAMDQLRTSHELIARLHGKDSPLVVATLWEWALAVEAAGDLARADSLLQELLRVCDGSSEDLRDYRAKALHESALINFNRGRYEESEQLFEEALPLARQIEGEGARADLAQSLHAFGCLLASTGRAQEGIRMLREALSMKRSLYDGDHPDIAENLVDLAVPLAQNGQGAEADSLVRLGVEMTRRTLGNDHPMTAENLTALGDVARMRQDFPTAVVAWKEAVRIQRKLHDGASVEEAICLYNLANVLEFSGNLEEADSRWRDAIAVLRRNLPDEGPRLSRYLVRLGLNLEQRGEYEEAEPVLRECLEIRQRVLSPDDWRNPNTMSLLGGVICARGRFAEAEPLLRQGYADLVANPEAIPSSFAESAPRDALQRLVALFEAWDAAEPQAGHDQEAARFRAMQEAGAPAK